MNTYTRLNHSTRKLARFMQYQGRTHFNLLLHLLRHLQCHRLRGGIKFYSDITKAPLYQHLTTTGNSKFADYPIMVFSDASFQDCPDSGRSTGGFLIFMQGGAVHATSTMPQLVAWSTCELEYCMGALATVRCSTLVLISPRLCCWLLTYLIHSMKCTSYDERET
jgi:hypothetical protein